MDYDKLASTYDSVRVVRNTIVKMLISEIESRKIVSILDFGCGTGSYLKCLNSALPYLKLYGLDQSIVMTEISKTNNPDVVIANGSDRHIPFWDGSFEMIYVVNVIHHIANLNLLFSEFSRVLSSKGCICIVTESKKQLKNRYLATYFPTAFDIDQTRFYDVSAIALVAKESGFICENLYEVNECPTACISKDFINIVKSKGYSVLHLISEMSYEAGLRSLMDDYDKRKQFSLYHGKTVIWFKRKQS